MTLQLTGEPAKDYGLLIGAVYEELDARIAASSELQQAFGKQQGKGSYQNADVQHNMRNNHGEIEFVISMTDGRPRRKKREHVLFRDWYSYPDPLRIVDGILEVFETLRATSL